MIPAAAREHGGTIYVQGMSSKPTEAALIAEYDAAYAAVLHYDGFRWSAGSMLIAGVFLFWGVVFTNDSAEELFAPASVVVTLVMTVWLLYANHYRQLYLLKLDRVHEIESILGLEANRRFVASQPGADPRYKAAGTKGHHLDSVLFALVSVSGPFFAYFRQGFRWWQLIPALLAGCAVGVVQRQDAQVRRRLLAPPAQAGQ